ncbi:yippee-domain-containing protein [Whalleya microplaca]|nr:yippee-domain-containing protein [Whalleya microplaca]
MFSMMLSEALPSPTPPPPAAAPNAGPKFPIYLLPSFNMPFRRRRRRSSLSISTCESPTSPTNDTTPPSLSTSPTDSTLSSSSPVDVDGPHTPTFHSSSPSRFSFSKAKGGLRRRSRTTSTESTEASRLSRIQPDTIRCSTCATDFALSEQIVSKGFTGRYGRAYLVSPPSQLHGGCTAGDLINIKVGKPETRQLVTGSHVVADITCAVCHAKVGWKYVNAKEESQKYKVGKFILETQRVVDFRSWEDVVVDEAPEIEMELKGLAMSDGEEPVVFDSDDEDECEDLFAGTWDPEVVAKRRGRKVNRRPKKSAD